MISSLSSTRSMSRTRGVGKGGSQWLGPCDENEYRLDQIRGPYSTCSLTAVEATSISRALQHTVLSG